MPRSWFLSLLRRVTIAEASLDYTHLLVTMLKNVIELLLLANSSSGKNILSLWLRNHGDCVGRNVAPIFTGAYGLSRAISIQRLCGNSLFLTDQIADAG